MTSIGIIANTMTYLRKQSDIDKEDYLYYKYCEKEWESFEVTEEISSYMNQFVEEYDELFTNFYTDGRKGEENEKTIALL